jgi:hypothetical protein
MYSAAGHDGIAALAEAHIATKKHNGVRDDRRFRSALSS